MGSSGSAQNYVAEVSPKGLALVATPRPKSANSQDGDPNERSSRPRAQRWPREPEGACCAVRAGLCARAPQRPDPPVLPLPPPHPAPPAPRPPEPPCKAWWPLEAEATVVQGSFSKLGPGGPPPTPDLSKSTSRSLESCGAFPHSAHERAGLLSSFLFLARPRPGGFECVSTVLAPRVRAPRAGAACCASGLWNPGRARIQSVPANGRESPGRRLEGLGLGLPCVASGLGLVLALLKKRPGSLSAREIPVGKPRPGLGGEGGRAPLAVVRPSPAAGL